MTKKYKPKNIPFSHEGASAEQILQRADEMARTYQARIEAQAATITRLVEGTYSGEVRSWVQYEDDRGVRSTYESSVFPPVRSRTIFEVYGEWEPYRVAPGRLGGQSGKDQAKTPS